MLRKCAVLVALGMTGTQTLLKQILYEFELVEAVFVRYGWFQGYLYHCIRVLVSFVAVLL
jgi:hypothetical protein